MIKRYFKIFSIFFLQTLKTELTYRSQILQRMFGVAIFCLPVVYFWLAAMQTAKIGKFTTESLLCYFIIACFHDFLFISGSEFAKKVGEDIRMGKLSAALVQPFPYLLKIFANGLGGIVLRILMLIPLGIFLKMTVLETFVLQDPTFQIGFYVLALLLAILISSLCLIITGLLAFDMTHVWAPWILFVASYCLLSGIFYPADQVTGFMKFIMPYLPFYYMVGFPSLILVGHLDGNEVMSGLLHVAGIVFYLVILLNFMWRRGIKKFEAIGL